MWNSESRWRQKGAHECESVLSMRLIQKLGLSFTMSLLSDLRLAWEEIVLGLLRYSIGPGNVMLTFFYSPIHHLELD